MDKYLTMRKIPTLRTKLISRRLEARPRLGSRRWMHSSELIVTRTNEHFPRGDREVDKLGYFHPKLTFKLSERSECFKSPETRPQIWQKVVAQNWRDSHGSNYYLASRVQQVGKTDPCNNKWKCEDNDEGEFLSDETCYNAGLQWHRIDCDYYSAGEWKY